ncbi:MAG: hypothetical protein IPI54_17735 [Chitinophagaceae bacterium]|nr:hypothetical protein [Chitinophagaceae bacterium]
MQKLSEQYKEKAGRVIGFLANDFKEQEKGKRCKDISASAGSISA